MQGSKRLVLLLIIFIFFTLTASAQEAYNIQQTGEIFNFWSSVSDIEIVDTTAILSTYAGIFFLDISTPSEPTLISRLHDYCRGQFKIQGNLIYSYFYSYGSFLNVCDMTDVANPLMCCEYSTENDIKYLDFYNDQVVMRLADSTLAMMDFSDYNSPEILGNYSINGDAGNFSIFGDLLFMPVVTNEGGSSISILDISNPADISQFGSISFSDLECDISDSDVILFDNIAYIFWGTDLYIYDISNPSAPSQLNTTNLPEANCRTISPEDSQLFISGDILSIYDISDPSYPVIQTTYAIPDSIDENLPFHYTLVPSETSAGNNVLGVVIGEDYSGGIANRFVSFLDINDLSSITESYFIDYLERISDVKIDENLLFAKGIKQRIVDISSLENYEELGIIDKRFDEIEVNSNYLFGYTDRRIDDEDVDSLYFYDISDPDSPQIVNSFGTSMGQPELSASEEYLVLTQDTYDYSHVLIYDVSNAADITGPLMQQGYPELGYRAYDSVIIGNYVYVVGRFGDFDLQVYEIFGTGDSRYLAIRSEVTIDEEPTEWYSNISIEDGHLVLNSGSCYTIMNIADRINPTILFKDTDVVIYDIGFKENHVFLSTRNGIEIVDITNPEDTWISGYYYYDYRYGFELAVDNRGIFVPLSTRIDVFDYSPAMDVKTLLDDIAPADYELFNAYPNPFNPSLNVRVSLPETGKLHLSVHNVLGQEVAVLSDRTLERGYHNFTFDGSDLSSGVYFVKAYVEGKMNDVQKVVLMK